MNNRKNVISEGTLIPLSLLIIILVGVVRVESTSFKANANEKEIQDIKDSRKIIVEELKKHGEALARIEATLGTTKVQAQTSP